MPTALYVERDPSYLLVRRRMVGTMTRAEWDTPALRQAALDRWWELARSAIRAEGEELVSEVPAALFCDPFSGQVHYANINPSGRPQWIDPLGVALSRPPRVAPVRGLTRVNTTYRTWAEGPLPHVEPDMLPALTPLDDPTVQEIRAQNASLRELIDGAFSPTNFAEMPRLTPTTEHVVDFRIRGVCRRRDFRVLRSLQDEALGSKILTADGVIE